MALQIRQDEEGDLEVAMSEQKRNNVEEVTGKGCKIANGNKRKRDEEKGRRNQIRKGERGRRKRKEIEDLIQHEEEMEMNVQLAGSEACLHALEDVEEEDVLTQVLEDEMEKLDMRDEMVLPDTDLHVSKEVEAVSRSDIKSELKNFATKQLLPSLHPPYNNWLKHSWNQHYQSEKFSHLMETP